MVDSERELLGDHVETLSTGTGLGVLSGQSRVVVGDVLRSSNLNVGMPSPQDRPTLEIVLGLAELDEKYGQHQIGPLSATIGPLEKGECTNIFNNLKILSHH